MGQHVRQVSLKNPLNFPARGGIEFRDVRLALSIEWSNVRYNCLELHKYLALFRAGKILIENKIID